MHALRTLNKKLYSLQSGIIYSYYYLNIMNIFMSYDGDGGIIDYRVKASLSFRKNHLLRGSYGYNIVISGGKLDFIIIRPPQPGHQR